MNYYRFKLLGYLIIPCLTFVMMVGEYTNRAIAATISAAGDASIHYYVQDWDPAANEGAGGPTSHNTAPAAVQGRIDDRWAIVTTSTVTGNVVGTGGSFGVDRYAAVHQVMFELPERPAGHVVDATSSLAVWLASRTGLTDANAFNVDVWGLGYRPSATNSTDDYQDVDGDDDPGTGGGLSAHNPQRREVLFSNLTDLGAGLGIASRMKVVDNLLTLDSSTNAYSTASSADLAAFLNAIYDAGAGAGDFAVFRLNPDNGLTPSSVNTRYNLGSMETAANDAQAAQLTIDFVAIPEPATVLLFVCGSLVLTMRPKTLRSPL